MWDDLTSTSRTDVFLNFNLAEDSPYIGSGQLDGNGIPSDFFADINVRKAFNHCFDYDTYIAEAQQGRGVRNNGPIILDMLGYNPDGEMYEYDPAMCEELLATAHGGVLPDIGFRFQIAFNTGNTTRQTAAAIFQSELAAINPLYQVEIVGLAVANLPALLPRRTTAGGDQRLDRGYPRPAQLGAAVYGGYLCRSPEYA